MDSQLIFVQDFAPALAGKVNLMAHAKRSTNRDFKLNKRPAQPRSAAVMGAMGVDARAPPEVRRQQPTMSIHPACAAAAVVGPSAHSEVSSSAGSHIAQIEHPHGLGRAPTHQSVSSS